MCVLKNEEHQSLDVAFKSDINAALCMCLGQVHPNDVFIFNENELVIEFEESIFPQIYLNHYVTKPILIGLVT